MKYMGLGERKGDFERMMRTDGTKIIDCIYCGRSYKTIKGFNRHSCLRNEKRRF